MYLKIFASQASSSSNDWYKIPESEMGTVAVSGSSSKRSRNHVQEGHNNVTFSRPKWKYTGGEKNNNILQESLMEMIYINKRFKLEIIFCIPIVKKLRFSIVWGF